MKWPGLEIDPDWSCHPVEYKWKRIFALIPRRCSDDRHWHWLERIWKRQLLKHKIWKRVDRPSKTYWGETDWFVQKSI